MAEHHALRAPGGAAGVENAGEIVAAPAGVRDGRAGRDQVLVGEHSRRRRAVADADDVSDIGQPAARNSSRIGRKASSIMSAEQPESASQNAISGGASRVLIGTNTKPPQAQAKKYSR